MTEKLLTPIEIGLTAAIVSIDGNEPLILTASGSDGDVSLVLMLDLETEVEMKLPGRYKVSPQIAGAIKAVSGVVDVQTL